MSTHPRSHFLSHLLCSLPRLTDSYNIVFTRFMDSCLIPIHLIRLLSTCHVHHKLCTIDQENMLPPFLDAMRDNAEGTPADIQEPTDDSAFEKRSRELVTLYRYTSLTHPVSDHILTPSHSHTLTPSYSYPHTLISYLHILTPSHSHTFTGYLMPVAPWK